MTCPQVRQYLFVFPGGVTMVPFTTPHRWRLSSASAGSLTSLTYAENVGYTDGSVQFYWSNKGGTFRPQ
jgi:hypothetical protein